MSKHPSDETILAWARLVRAEQAVLGRIEASLKAADLPPLAWYDVLLELAREAQGRLRPVDLERRLLLAQYNASRLIDRMVKADLVTREACAVDGRSQWVAISPKGRKMRQRIWRVYGPAIERHVGSKLQRDEAAELAKLLERLI